MLLEPLVALRPHEPLELSFPAPPHGRDLPVRTGSGDPREARLDLRVSLDLRGRQPELLPEEALLAIELPARRRAHRHQDRPDNHQNFHGISPWDLTWAMSGGGS